MIDSQTAGAQSREGQARRRIDSDVIEVNDVAFELPTSKLLENAGVAPDHREKRNTEPASSCSFCLRLVLIGLLSLTVMSSSVLSKLSFLGEDKCPYEPSSVTLTQELVKALISYLMLLAESLRKRCSEGGIEAYADSYERKVCCKSGTDCLKYAIPGGLYMLGNNVKFFALAYLSPAEFSLVWNIKIVATVCLMVTFLRRKFTRIQYLAIGLIVIGVTLSEIPSKPHSNPSLVSHSIIAAKNDTAGSAKILVNEESKGLNQLKLFGALITVFGAVVNGGGNVIIEYVYKSGTEGFWIQNLRLYLFGILYNGIALLIRYVRNESNFGNGFFTGWNHWTILVTLAGSCDGLLIGFLMRYADNVAVIHADVLGTIFNIILSTNLFGLKITPLFSIASGIILASIYLFHSNDFECFERERKPYESIAANGSESAIMLATEPRETSM